MSYGWPSRPPEYPIGPVTFRASKEVENSWRSIRRYLEPSVNQGRRAFWAIWVDLWGRKDCHAGIGISANYGQRTRPSFGGFFADPVGGCRLGRMTSSPVSCSPSRHWYIR